MNMTGMMGGGTFGMFLWSLLGLVVLMLAVIGGVWALRAVPGGPSRPALRSPARPSTSDPTDPAQDELRRRYAAGEISREDYLQGKVDLE